MAKIKNPTIFSDYFKIRPKVLDKYELFNPVVNVDTKLFIDPLLLARSKHSLIRNESVKEFTDFFGKIIKLLANSKKEGDVAWRAAEKMLPRKEIEGTCLGYGVNSISGRSITTEVRMRILQTAKDIIDLGIDDPSLFMLLPLFEDGIGPDTISDITTRAIENSLLDFTQKMANKLGVKTTAILLNNKKIKIIINPLKKRRSPIILLPHDILRHLPIVKSWDEVAEAASFNEDLRNRVNKMIAKIWKAKTKEEKRKQKKELLRDKKAIEVLIKIVHEGRIRPYDFEKDKLSIIAWEKLLSNVSSDYPLKIENIGNSIYGLTKCVTMIIEQFKFLVEQKGINKLLWKEKNKPNNEDVSQMLFFATAYSYCKSNNIDINPEMDTGTGCVDFKFSSGFTKRIIVEIKHSYNQNIIHGFKTQLETYKESEETQCGYYVIVDVGGMGKKYKELIRLYNNDQKKLSQIIYIDGRKKLSASKR